jgi:osmoprotectant transport system substrate-binding protein
MSTTVRHSVRTLGVLPLASALVLVLMLVLTGCVRSVPAAAVPESITIGSQSGFTSQVIAHLYGEALEAHGYAVSYNYGIGSRAAFLKKLEGGSLDIVPDYAGALLDDVASTATASSTDDVMDQLPDALAPLKLTVLDASSAQKSRAYLVNRDFAASHNLRSIADLAPIASALTIGSSENLGVGTPGRDALSFSYGVTGWLLRQGKDDDAVIADLRRGAIQVADVSTLHLDAVGNDLVELADPKHIVEAQNVVPLVRTAAATGAVREVLDAVSAKLVTSDLTAFAGKDSDLADTVAHRWLVSRTLLAD